MRQDLAALVGERDLLTLGSAIVTGGIYVDRRRHYYEPGDVFILSAPGYGVFNEVMRIADVDYGDGEDNRIRLDFASDIYNLKPQVLPEPPEYTPPPLILPPSPMNYRYVEECTYFMGCIEMGKPALDAALRADPDAGAIFVTGPAPANSTASAYVYAALSPSANFRPHQTMEFAPGCRLSEAVTRMPTDTVLSYGRGWNMAAVLPDNVAALGSELVRIVSVDRNAKTVTVARGILDTVPRAHPKGTLLVMLEGFGGFAEDNYTSELTYEVKLLPFNGSSRVDIADAPSDFVHMNSRAIRPYPVANFRVNGNFVYDVGTLTGTYNLTWNHRNRLQQTNTPAGYLQASVTPEPGMSYIFRVIGYEANSATGVVLVDENIGTVSSYAFDSDALVIPASVVSIEFSIIATRDGYENWTYVGVEATIPFNALMGVPYLWWDANIPNTLFRDDAGTTPVTSDADEVWLITPVTID